MINSKDVFLGKSVLANELKIAKNDHYFVNGLEDKKNISPYDYGATSVDGISKLIFEFVLGNRVEDVFIQCILPWTWPSFPLSHI